MSQTEFNQRLCQFLNQSPTPFHATAAMVERLQQAGFTQLSELDSWGRLAAGKYYVSRNDSSLIAFTLPEATDLAETGFHMLGAHTDSPCLKVKPQPEKQRHGLWQLGVEVYGGALLNPWFDRDLSMAGRVSYLSPEGNIEQCLVNFEKAVATIPNLAIHLDREANKNRTVNPQLHLPPVLMQTTGQENTDFRALLHQQIAEQYPDLKVDKVLDYEISFYDTQKANVIGLNDDFITSARLDNLLSCFIGLEALVNTDNSQPSMIICSDHEEVGSASTSGADGTFLESVLRRLAGDEESCQCML
jgi:aspartyl aminopeptidase